MPPHAMTQNRPHSDQAGKHGDGQPGGGHKVPFDMASYRYTEKFSTTTITLSTSQQPQPLAYVPTIGFLNGIYIEVANSVAGSLGSADAVLGSPTDFPFGIFSSITLEDQNGRAVAGPFSGYELFLSNKYGGYFYQGDPTVLPKFTATFAAQYFWLYIPVGINDAALGALPNTDARSQMRVNWTVDSSANLISTGTVTTQPQFTVKMWIDAYAQIDERTTRGDAAETQPPFIGTWQFWSREIVNVNSGAQTIKSTRVGLDIRSIIYELRNGVAATSSQPKNQRVTNLTDPIALRLDTTYLVHDESPNLRRLKIMAGVYNLTGAEGDPNPIGTPAKGFVDTGIYVYEWCDSASGHVDRADNGGWLETNQGQTLQLEDSLNATVATMTILTNDVAYQPETVHAETGGHTGAGRGGH